MENLISKFQSLNTDPIDLGRILRIKYPRRWKDIDWNQVYSNADITVDTSFTIKETGLFR